MDPEFLKGLQMADQAEQQRVPSVPKELRLYYDTDGCILGLHSQDYPAGNYIVLDNTEFLDNNNTLMLRVINGKLELPKLKTVERGVLKVGQQGQPTVKGLASIALEKNETYNEISYYERSTNN